MVRKLVYMFPLRRCECGGKAELCRYIYVTNKDENGWFIGCTNLCCTRMATKIYKYPIKAIVNWNLKDWKHSKDKFLTNNEVKWHFLAKQLRTRKENKNV